MRMQMKRLFQAIIILSLAPSISKAGRLVCPDSGDDLHHRDVMATSAPEIKVRATTQDDSHHWAEIVKPLVQKAIKLAKAQRGTLIEEGIERGCTSPQIYVGQMISIADKASGCDSRVVTRPGEEGHVWVQAIATCKYDWACCTPEEVKGSKTSAGSPVGYTLEGPLGGNPPASSKH